MRKPFNFNQVDISYEGTPLEPSLRNLEYSMIQDALKKTHHNKTRAAKLLRLRRTTLVAKMKRFGIELEKPSKKAAE